MNIKIYLFFFLESEMKEPMFKKTVKKFKV